MKNSSCLVTPRSKSSCLVTHGKNPVFTTIVRIIKKGFREVQLKSHHPRNPLFSSLLCTFTSFPVTAEPRSQHSGVQEHHRNKNCYFLIVNLHCSRSPYLGVRVTTTIPQSRSLLMLCVFPVVAIFLYDSSSSSISRIVNRSSHK